MAMPALSLRLEAGLDADGIDRTRPRTRGDCLDAPRPCPWVGCRHHLYLDVARTGRLVLRWPGRDVDELPESCSLDVADRGEHTDDEVGAWLDVRQQAANRTKQLALARMAKRLRGAR
jgi:hypothetical protein